MEAVSAGANASPLSYQASSIKSAQVIHDVFSTAQDAPQTVRNLVSHVAQLQGILRRL